MKKTMTEASFKFLMKAATQLDEMVKQDVPVQKMFLTLMDLAFFASLGVGVPITREQKGEWEKVEGSKTILRLKKKLLRICEAAQQETTCPEK